MLIDEEALLAALAEAPGDAGPRMAYADWLEERGDPRSEYLRAEGRLREAPPGDPSRQALGRAWRELRAAQDPAWLARVEPGAPVPAWVPIEARRPPRLGLDDWQEWASESHYEWVVLAVLAPIEAVARAVVEARAGSDPDAALASGLWRKDVPIRRGVEYEAVAGEIPFVQLKGHAWTVAMYDTFNLSLHSFYSAQADARALSERLGTIAVEYSAEDTSGATGYHLFECGELIEQAEDDCGELNFISKRRGPAESSTPGDFPDELFRSLGLYLPGFYAGGPGVRAGVPDPAEFARADLLDLRPHYREEPPAAVGFAEIHQLSDFPGDVDLSEEGDGDEEGIPS